MEKTRKVARIRNRLAPEIEQAILDYSLQQLTHGQKRVANEHNRKFGWQISDGGVRSVWLRHGLEVKSPRLKRLDKCAAERIMYFIRNLKSRRWKSKKKRIRPMVRLRPITPASFSLRTLIMLLHQEN